MTTSNPYDFRLIRPVTVTDSTLTSCTVPETTVTAYNAGTTYANGDTAGVAGTANSQVVYQSLQNANTGHTPASSPTWWQETGTVYGTYAGGTTYALDDIVTVIATDSHKLYQSLTAGNVGNAVTDTTKWLDLGNTNRWKQFDTAVNSQTTAPEQVSAVFTLGTLVNTVVLLNVSGTSATVSQSVSGYSSTKSLVTHDVLNWYDWYYEDLVIVGDVVFDDVPPYPASALTVTVANAGADASIGCCFIGKSRTIGSTAWEFTGGALSYSTTTTDTFGNTTMVTRANAKRLNFEIKIAAGFESEAYRLLRLYMDTEMVFIGSSDYSMSIAYGYLGQWEIPVSDSGKLAHVEVRGLT